MLNILKDFKNATFASMYISSKRPNVSNHWYWNWKVRPFGLYSMPKSKSLIWRLPWRRINSRVTQNRKQVTDNIMLWAKKITTIFCVSNFSKDKIKSSIFRSLARSKSRNDAIMLVQAISLMLEKNEDNPKDFFDVSEPLKRQRTAMKLCMLTERRLPVT